MKNETRKIYNGLLAHIAQLNDVADVSTKFAVAPTVSQAIETHIQESSAFLQLVNSIAVDEQQGEKVGLSLTNTIAGRTDTTSGSRQTTDISDTDGRGYDNKQTNFDTHIRYAQLDAWAKFPDFQTRVRDMLIRQMGLDRITIGWNGTSAAADTDRVANPLLEDVNIGWLAKLAAEASERYMTEGGTAGEIRVGEGTGADYKNMDQLVHSLRSDLLGPWHSRNNNFTVICGSELVDDKYFPMVGTHGGTPTESNALDLMLSHKKMGGLGVAEVPFFPTRGLMITMLGEAGNSNLSVYHQEGTRRRHIKDNPERDRIEDYQSVNESYVIEDLTACCAAINIKLWDGTAWV